MFSCIGRTQVSIAKMQVEVPSREANMFESTGNHTFQHIGPQFIGPADSDKYTILIGQLISAHMYHIIRWADDEIDIPTSGMGPGKINQLSPLHLIGIITIYPSSFCDIIEWAQKNVNV